METELEKIEMLISTAFLSHMGGEDNSWRCRHNLDILLEAIKDIYGVKTGGTVPSPFSLSGMHSFPSEK